MQRSERRRKKRQRELERQQRRREKEVQRYQKKRNRYGEEKVIRHAKHGVRSTLIAIAAIVLLSLLVTVSYVQEGKAATMITTFPLHSLLCKCSTTSAIVTIAFVSNP